MSEDSRARHLGGRSRLGGGADSVTTVAGLTFRVGWSEFERDHVARVDQLPALRCYDGTSQGALAGLMGMVLRGVEQGDEDIAPLLPNAEDSDALRAAIAGVQGAQ